MNLRRIGITGTYSSGKTFTSMALSNYLGLPRTRARTMREILPEAAPGKTLEQCSVSELITMIVTRHTERAVHERALATGFVSDGCSLQEWIYGYIRVGFGVNPNDSVGQGLKAAVQRTPELNVLEEVMQDLGGHFLRHVQQSFDGFLHLRNELELSADGHRPVNEAFRQRADSELRRHLDDLGLPIFEIRGAPMERLESAASTLEMKPVMSVDEAIDRAASEYRSLDVRSETERLEKA